MYKFVPPKARQPPPYLLMHALMFPAAVFYKHNFINHKSLQRYSVGECTLVEHRVGLKDMGNYQVTTCIRQRL